MIESIKVDGFRSLSNFELKIVPGLNILIGPNGSGKTNIILFFEFLSRVLNEDLAGAISNSGGAAAVFQRTRKDEFARDIRATVTGTAQRAFDAREIAYSYDFIIHISDDRNEVIYAEQTLRIATKKSARRANKRWDLVVTQTVDEELVETIKIERIDFRKHQPPPLHRYIVSHSNRKQLLDEVESFIYSRTYENQNLIQGLRPAFSSVTPVLLDLSGAFSFNIVPSAVRELEDSASPPGIRPDGSGVAATLFAIKKFGEEPFRPTKSRRRPRNRGIVVGPGNTRVALRPRLYEELVKYTNLVNDQIIEIEVTNDPEINKLQVHVTHRKDDSFVKMPLAAMSDGTIKWISLIAAVLTYRSIFAIEEPENFLHPLMQIEIVKIMRSSAQSRRVDNFILMTTHSETLLNAAEPNEVVVVSMKDGTTIASRPQNQAILEEEIKRTGFGLGHYYLTGALDDA